MIVDDHAEVRDQLRRILGEKNILGEASNVGGVKELIMRLDETSIPTHAVVDDMMPKEGDGKVAAQILRDTFHKIKIVSLSSHLQDYGDVNLPKNASISELRNAIFGE